MASVVTREKKHVGILAPVMRSPEEIRRILKRTWGLWRGRKINPIAYQRKMRKEYETAR